MKKFFTAKLSKIMKMCATQGMIAVLLCGIAIANDNFGQAILEKEVTVTITNASFEEALQLVAAAANAKFAYSAEILNVSDRITINATNQRLGDLLNKLLHPLQIKYVLHKDGYTISLQRAEKNKEDNETRFDSPARMEEAQRIVTPITGIINDASGQPLPGVSIIIKGSTTGTSSDASGKYTINAEENDVLIFSFIGFATIEMKVNNQSVMDVILQEDVLNLGEIIVNVGYWEVKQKEQTGSVSRVTSSEIQKQNISNPLQSLQGRMTGVYVQQSTGMAGGGIKIQVRGQNSLRTGNELGGNGNLPLYLVDGVPFTSTSLTSPAISGGIAGGNPLSTINPNDIESIEVLKDADATAIYGSRGANGVILITTKRAKSGKAKVDLDFNQGIGEVSHFMHLLNSSQYVSMRKEAFKNDGVTPAALTAPDVFAWDTTRSTDWQKELIGGKAHITNANLTLSGGTFQTQFLFGGGYYRETPVFRGDNAFQRGSGRLSVRHHSLNDRFKLEVGVNYSFSANDLPASDFTLLAVTLAPTAPALYDQNGNLNWENSTWTNPLASLKRKYKSTIENLVSNASIGYEVIKGLNVKSSFGFTSMNVNEVSTIPISSFDPQYYSLVTGATSFGDGTLKTWIIEPQVDYTSEVGPGIFSALLGSTFQKSIQKNKAIDGYGYTNDALIENMNAATSFAVTENNYAEYKYGAAFARLNYNLKEKYILNLTARRDGSSRFGTGNRFANFGAIGAAWIFSNESWISDKLSFLSFGKLRSSFGITGSDAIGNYQYLETFKPTTYAYGGTSGLALARLSNPQYSWETNKKFEIGLDLGFLDDRITLAASYYLNRSGGQLVGLPLPVVTGQSSVQFNLPATVQNEGWELQVSASIIKKQNFEWSTGVNVTLPTNKLIDFPDLEKFPAYNSKYDVGRSIYIYKGYESSGINPKTGLYTVVDQNNDGVFTSVGDFIGLKKNTQTMYGGISNTVKYGSVQLDFLFQFVKQTGFNYKRSFQFPGTQSNQPVQVLDRWQSEGDEKTIQKFSFKDPTGAASISYYNNVGSDNSIADASFIRLKNVSLSWELPSKWMKGIKMEGSRLFVQGQNLFVITNYVGMDPETQNSNSLPPLRLVTAGFHIAL